MSRPARGGWIEILFTENKNQLIRSRPARGGWIEIDEVRQRRLAHTGPAPHGAGGLKSPAECPLADPRGPAPHGAGGLKYDSGRLKKYNATSRPARGGWIEIGWRYAIRSPGKSRPARGGWIEINPICPDGLVPSRPAPHGAGGLKYLALLLLTLSWPSRPARGGWIEIGPAGWDGCGHGSRPARGGWIEIGEAKGQKHRRESRPARGGWIEIA